MITFERRGRKNCSLDTMQNRNGVGSTRTDHVATSTEQGRNSAVFDIALEIVAELMDPRFGPCMYYVRP